MREPVKNQRALTMIEVVVALIIITLLATISLTSISGRKHLSVVAAQARKIDRALATARSYALAENGHFQVLFLLDKRVFWIDETDAEGNVIRPKIVSPQPFDEDIIIPDIIVDSIVHQTDPAAIRFFPGGKSSEAAIYILRKGDEPTNERLYYTVKLYSPTGRSDILENQRR